MMDKTGAYSNSRTAIRTDLSLLLECLKFQMKSPELQKQALLTIHSICENRDDNVDLLREMGGVAFVYNLSKSTIVHSDVKETALFTIGTLAGANVFCKNSLCRKETFADLAGWLMNEHLPLTQKRVSVYLLSVLVANNKLGQSLALTTGCVDILLDLFRTTFPLSKEATAVIANAPHTYQLWASVSSALCGCVNNPQNEEGQRICVAAFPMINIWLQQIALARTEIFQSICSFIAMTVANNCYVQESFSASGGLETLTRSLLRLASVADTSSLSCQLSVIISKTLSACVTENSALASGLAQYGIVSHLLSLLGSPNLDLEDRLSVLLTLGHCTEASEDHQSQLVQCGGLPLIITLLTEDTCEEVRKAATFILQTCKPATVSLVPGLTAGHGEDKNMETLAHMESFRCTAQELLSRINQLEEKQAKGAEDEQEEKDPSTSTEGPAAPSPSPALPLPLQRGESISTLPKAYRQSSTRTHMEAEGDNRVKLQTGKNVVVKKFASKLRKMSSNLSCKEEKVETSRGDEWCSECKGVRAKLSPHAWSVEGGRESHTADSQLFQPPAHVRHSAPIEMNRANEELHDCDMSDEGEIKAEEHSVSLSRCAGCVLPFDNVTSRTFASLQSSCHHSCDMHRALQGATDQFRAHHCSLLFRRENQDHTVELTHQNPERVSRAGPHRRQEHRSVNKVSLTPVCKEAGKLKRCFPEAHRKKQHGIALTPLHRGAKNRTETSRNKTERRGRNNLGHCVLDNEPKTSTDLCSTRRKRKDFCLEEVHYLLNGVKRFGFSWNSILWSYPFQPGRTNVDLAKKYRQLMKHKTMDDGADH
ncbi:telomere repeats-binding bouquet formation protein 1 isoform X1 [Hippoglossus stenolepis]|uniref:telomere repeats-binding bouquet formation protein 1 isoform X1 n=1 Tax=Hippoglossus stenolepis TaxID=195615 RepID=UPI00159C9925|nr:telomere repeats-binding bouquet formation protein 1 isoform X1 [Hippoglossus stenolepis]